MKDLTKIFSRRYSAVNMQDTEQQQQQLTACAQTSNLATATTGPYIACSTTRTTEKQQNKSLKANRKMNPAGILSSFFNERKSNERARAPKCKLNLNE